MKERNDVYASLLITSQRWGGGRKLKRRLKVKGAFAWALTLYIFLEHRAPPPYIFYIQVSNFFAGRCGYARYRRAVMAPPAPRGSGEKRVLERKPGFPMALRENTLGKGKTWSLISEDVLFNLSPSSPSFMYHLGWDNILTRGLWKYINHALVQ